MIALGVVALLVGACFFYFHRRRARLAKAMAYLSEVGPVAGYLGPPSASGGDSTASQRDSVSHVKGPRARINDAPEPSEVTHDTGAAIAAAMPPPPRRPGFFSQLRAFFFRRRGTQLEAVWRQFEDGSAEDGKSDLPVGNDDTVVHSDLESTARTTVDPPISPEPPPSYARAASGSNLMAVQPGSSAAAAADGADVPSVPTRWRRASAMQRALNSEAAGNSPRTRKPGRAKGGLLGQQSAIAEDDNDERPGSPRGRERGKSVHAVTRL